MNVRKFLIARARWLLALVLVLGLGTEAQTPSNSKGEAEQAKQILQIPVGTILPVRLNRGVSSKSAKPGQEITGRIMQDVPLPAGGRIREGAKVLGKIVDAEPSSIHGGGRLTMRFDRIEVNRQESAIVANLRALASTVEVQEAQVPDFSPGFGTPYNWVTTTQVGGDVVYGVGGPVTDTMSEHVGRAVNGGVLIQVRARADSTCRGALNSEAPLQALWVFSSDACGVYGMEGTRIEKAGRTEPVGEIILVATKGDVRLRMGSGMLLRIVR